MRESWGRWTALCLGRLRLREAHRGPVREHHKDVGFEEFYATFVLYARLFATRSRATRQVPRFRDDAQARLAPRATYLFKYIQRLQFVILFTLSHPRGFARGVRFSLARQARAKG